MLLCFGVGCNPVLEAIVGVVGIAAQDWVGLEVLVAQGQIFNRVVQYRPKPVWAEFAEVQIHTRYASDAGKRGHGLEGEPGVLQFEQPLLVDEHGTLNTAADLRKTPFASAERLAQINAHLWSYDADSFLAHGGPEDGHAGDQPIYLTCLEENPNEATVLLLAEGAEAGDRDLYDRCLDLFDGNDEHALGAARGRWKALKEAGYPLTYWAQTQDGRWEKRADASND